ncbi:MULTISPECIES: putative baseplate assembly protein [Catenuloplanes]|uniref:Phage baseplate assembly protein n=1 Tax=Catenuloplanes niger TaxID=587534 RepID=A0AAE3ZWR7_9ACTN|nr:putative baseplate assembly protein [Catenuloplanes niger]MDR7327322.1 putative phage baseplate assembly protein [Catenuloplanes niger]
MTDVWWERAGSGTWRPDLVDATRESVRAAIGARIPAYTPEWTDPDRHDAGVALVRVFGAQAEPVLERVNRLPEKVRAEHLTIAGVRPLPAAAATALLAFTVSPPGTDSLLIPAGFQAGAQPATGTGGQVVFETAADLWATEATIGAVLVGEGGRLQTVSGATSGNRPFAPFGPRPAVGTALWIGLTGDATPYPELTLGVVVPDANSPVTLRWDVLDGDRFVAAQVVADGTGGLRGTGVIALRTPRTWRPGRPAGTGTAPRLRWLRVLLDGPPATVPVLAAVRLNMVAATAARTVRDEVPQAVQGGPVDGRTRMTLSQTPIVPGSVRLAVESDDAADVFGTVVAPVTTWREVASLAGRSPDERVFTVDHTAGVLTFGDGVHGARVPLGFRTVVAERYRAGGGAAGAVPAGAVAALVTAQAYVTGVTNPFPARGGADAEPPERAARRGAAQLGSGGRAVTPGDYALLALRTPGALVARAHGVAGLDPERPGAPRPGVVGVLVVPALPDGEEPPVPGAATLRAVAEYLSAEAAPAGVRVVAGAPDYRRVATEAWIVPDPDADRAAVFAAAADALVTFLHPVRGGPAGDGWPFGGPIRHTHLMRRLLAVPGVRAVPRLRLIVAGVAVPSCGDHALPRHALPWPSRPLIFPADPEVTP